MLMAMIIKEVPDPLVLVLGQVLFVLAAPTIACALSKGRDGLFDNPKKVGTALRFANGSMPELKAL